MLAISMVAAALLAVIDQVIKYYVELNLKPIGFIELIKNFLYLDYTENTGVAFGLLKDMSWIYIPITVLGCLVLLFILIKYKNEIGLLGNSAVVLLIGGGVGNLIDRIRIGYVIDYIRVDFFKYIFNFADCCVVVGSVLLVLTVFLFDRKERKQEEEA